MIQLPLCNKNYIYLITYILKFKGKCKRPRIGKQLEKEELSGRSTSSDFKSYNANNNQDSVLLV